MKNRDRYNPSDESAEERFLGDDAYDVYDGPDLSDDPMAADDRRVSRKERKRLRREAEEKERREREKAALRAEILAELKAGQQTNYTNGDEPGKNDDNRDEKREANKSRFSDKLMSVLSGNILSKKEVKRVYPYLLFIAFLMLVYIGNVFRMQQLYRTHDKLTVQVKELRAKSMTLSSQKMEETKQSNIIKEIERRGIPLKESLTPNKVIPE